MLARWVVAASLALALGAGPAYAVAVSDDTTIDLNVSGSVITPTSTPTPTPVPDGGAALPTTELTIFGISVVQLGPTEVTLTWGTNRPATTELRYGRTNLYELGHLSRDVGLTASHQLTITGLQPQTVYHLQVVARDSNGFLAQSGDYIFLTEELPDTEPPPNVASLRIVPGDSQLQLLWLNPDVADFAGVVVVRRDDRAPTSPDDGTVVARTLATELTDTGLQNGQRYYYGVFAFDRFGNYSTGSLGSGVPTAPPADDRPPVVPGPPPPVLPQYPPVRPEERLGEGALQFLANGGTLRLAEDDRGRVVVVSGYPFEVVLPFSAVTKPVRRVAIEVQVGPRPEDVETFWLQPRPLRQAYVVGLSLPVVAGDYPVAVYVQYETETQDTIRRTVRVEARGVVIGHDTNQPLVSAVVVLWQAGERGWEVWHPSPGTAANPQLTDSHGTYAFLVPPGQYRLEVLRAGYRRLTREVMSAYGVVAEQLELEPETVIRRASPQLINLILAALLLVVGWQLRRLLRR